MRRTSIAALAVWAALTVSGIATTYDAAPARAETVFTLPPLPYAPSALEPVIDTETMTLHHDKHHQAYVDALNKAVAADPALQDKSLEQLVEAAGTLPDVVRNNAGGHWNHSFFWATMAPPAQSGQPSAALQAAIDRQFGSTDAFEAAFDDAGTKRFGSGWVWLIVGHGGELAITSTPNQDNPLMDVADVKGAPILGNDVWEHAYYLKHQNRRAEYLTDWWQVVNWATVSDRYAAATAR
ncbi:superoxide dismutase [Mycobacterium sp. AT1]|uniref:superoxide dismutase n=1 Tax=Mycobacterium sp. AT1 TaxID=1961706 RepID=UPI0009AD90C4|nr:superoxide dismutase [Mycobacterium sp. AT1]OPX13040.1 superoxide dismutase [Mycobacterium sp. AT1]